VKADIHQILFSAECTFPPWILLVDSSFSFPVRTLWYFLFFQFLLHFFPSCSQHQSKDSTGKSHHTRKGTHPGRMQSLRCYKSAEWWKVKGCNFDSLDSKTLHFPHLENVVTNGTLLHSSIL
jgi:hypothetical protein